MVDKKASLTPLAWRIICEKATEYPGTGQYINVAGPGSYLCRRCGLALFRVASQFHSGCGWPGFDDSIDETVKQLPDADGLRTEIICNRCEGHLGHVFSGEGFTDKNLRHCVNSASIDFVGDTEVLDTEEAIIAGGCFWGVDYYLRRLPGVLNVEAGYIGGDTTEPSYEQVCHGNSGHLEGVRVVYDIRKTDYHSVIKHFFEIHDPTDRFGQGPDKGPQYQSAVFYYNQEQHEEAHSLIQTLKQRGFAVVTRLREVQTFWPAENYHQNYYGKHNKTPYCHHYIARFG